MQININRFKNFTTGMKTAIIIHGYPSKRWYFNPKMLSPSNSNWLPWIQKQLLIKGILAQTPEMPDAYELNYEKWKWMFEQFEIDEKTILVGHSCGGGFLVRWLSENNKKVGKVVLVAPWINPKHEADGKFFEFNIDENLVSKTASVKIMYSTDDDLDIIESINILKSKLKGADFHEFTDKGHFVSESMHTEKFPELLENLIS